MSADWVEVHTCASGSGALKGQVAGEGVTSGCTAQPCPLPQIAACSQGRACGSQDILEYIPFSELGKGESQPYHSLLCTLRHSPALLWASGRPVPNEDSTSPCYWGWESMRPGAHIPGSAQHVAQVGGDSQARENREGQGVVLGGHPQSHFVASLQQALGKVVERASEWLLEGGEH